MAGTAGKIVLWSIEHNGRAAIAGNAALRTGDAETGIAPIFDNDRVQKEIDAQIKITQEFGKLASKAVGDYAKGKYEEALRSNNPEDAEKWAEGGAYRVAAHALVGGLTGGVQGAVGAASSQAVIDQVGQAVKHSDLPEEIKHALVLAAGTAVGAVTGGSAGMATAFNATANNYLNSTDLRNRDQRLADARKKGDVQAEVAILQEYDAKSGKNTGAIIYRSVLTESSLQAEKAQLEQLLQDPAISAETKVQAQRSIKELDTAIHALQKAPILKEAAELGLMAADVLSLGGMATAKALTSTVVKEFVAARTGRALSDDAAAALSNGFYRDGAQFSGANGGTAGTAGSSVNVGPWSKGITNVVENGTFTQCGNGSCVSATAQVLTNGTVTEAQVVARIGEWADPLKLPGVLNDLAPGSTPWRGGYFGSSADAVTIANKGPMGAVLQAPGEAAHMVTISPVPGSPGMFRVQDTGVGKTYDVPASWIGKYVVGGVWK